MLNLTLAEKEILWNLIGNRCIHLQRAISTTYWTISHTYNDMLLEEAKKDIEVLIQVKNDCDNLLAKIESCDTEPLDEKRRKDMGSCISLLLGV
jgi:hypothetical protein